jgi:hypothetical protein
MPGVEEEEVRRIPPALFCKERKRRRGREAAVCEEIYSCFGIG